MIVIKTLNILELETLRSIITGYVSNEKYVVNRLESERTIRFNLERTALDTPYHKHYTVLESDFEYYQTMLPEGFCFGAYNDTALVGIAIANSQDWNQTLWLHELHVLAPYRGQGIGRLLIEALIQKAQNTAYRMLVCETQNTNVPAIQFYQRLGFMLDGIDLSLYSNEDYPDGEMAFFMKRKL